MTVAYDKLIASGAVADDAIIASSEWAQKIKDAGTMRLGVVQTSMLFSLLNEKDGKLRGFDAGLSQLLVRYILGDESKFEATQVTSDTRESVLQNDQVDAVFATYSITEDRKKLISFAGPYYGTQQSILVLADNDDIASVDDLSSSPSPVPTMARSSPFSCSPTMTISPASTISRVRTWPPSPVPPARALWRRSAQTPSFRSSRPTRRHAVPPDAKLQEFKTDEEARSALAQGRVDAYVIDRNMLFSDMMRQPGKYKMAGEPFGPEDLYGIGLPLDSDGVAFVNAFLTKVEEDGTWEELWKLCIGDGTWEELWKLCIGDRAEIDEVPQPPAIGA